MADTTNASRASQTARSFRDKWTHNPNLAFDETLREGSEIFIRRVDLWYINGQSTKGDR